MTFQSATVSDNLISLPKLPAWVTSGCAETLETVAFRSGATLTILDQLISDPSKNTPLKLLANWLALTAATANSKIEGRLAREADIRDAFHLVWSTMYRFKVLRGDIQERVREIVQHVCAENGVDIISGVVSNDHVHIFVSIPPKLSVSDFMRKVKGRSSFLIQREFPVLKKR